MAETFGYRDASLSEPQVLRVDDEGVRDGAGRAVCWADLTEIGFDASRHRGRTNMGLAFRAHGGGFEVGFIGYGRDVLDFHRLVLGVARAAARARPDLKVALGHRGLVRWMLFGLGLVLMALGALLVVFAFDVGLDLLNGEDITLLASGGVSGYLGVRNVAQNQPFAPPPQETIQTFLARAERGADALMY
jgi:hypothetical protein